LKPRILLSASNTETLKNYINSVKESQGIPFPIFSETTDTKKFDGLILCGGGDISPSYYGQENNGSYDIDTKRDICEFKLIESFIKEKKPIFGICRGHQVINVFFGGDLFQDIESSKFHKGTTKGDSIHKVHIKPGSKLSRIYGRSIITNSSHHQAINKLGEGIMSTVLWHEEINEASEHISLPIFSVQWHPERIFQEQIENGLAQGKKLFDYFISLC